MRREAGNLLVARKYSCSRGASVLCGEGEGKRAVETQTSKQIIWKKKKREREKNKKIIKKLYSDHFYLPDSAYITSVLRTIWREDIIITNYHYFSRFTDEETEAQKERK